MGRVGWPVALPAGQGLSENLAHPGPADPAAQDGRTHEAMCKSTPRGLGGHHWTVEAEALCSRADVKASLSLSGDRFPAPDKK